MAKPDRFDLLLANYKSLLPALRDKFGRSNCPLTAEAVWKYLVTGKMEPARMLLPGQTKMLQCIHDGDAKETTIKALRRRLVKGGHGTHVVVTANPGDKDEHNFNVVNIRGTVYLVDAYNEQPVLTLNLEDHLGYARKLEASRDWELHVVPVEMVSSFRCH